MDAGEPVVRSDLVVLRAADDDNSVAEAPC
jgi:hypothetical protein